ncbi:MAG: hypothetical protein K2J82_05635 [Muribaculaceae bacterium]|nr:hypothetical protein [Muribaculaceae bacterium]MDE6754080.1 hypothetical protein [Muribaculaceae bacterium]
MLCMVECLDLLDNNIFTYIERSLLKEGIYIWKHTYDSIKLHDISIRFYQILLHQNYNNNIKKEAMEAAACVLMPFESWYPETYLRPFALEYFMGHMLYVDVSWDKLAEIIIRDYGNIVDFNSIMF